MKIIFNLSYVKAGFVHVGQCWNTFQGKTQNKLFLPYGRMVSWKCVIKAAKIRPVRVTRDELDVKQHGSLAKIHLQNCNDTFFPVTDCTHSSNLRTPAIFYYCVLLFCGLLASEGSNCNLSCRPSRLTKTSNAWFALTSDEFSLLFFSWLLIMCFCSANNAKNYK